LVERVENEISIEVACRHHDFLDRAAAVAQAEDPRRSAIERMRASPLRVVDQELAEKLLHP
jgi:hypothetical protein